MYATIRNSKWVEPVPFKSFLDKVNSEINLCCKNALRDVDQ